jgi:hypothetical protein
MRTLATIVRDLELALKREVKNVIDIGRLLVEAKKQVKHGDWYDWLQRNFALSVASASWHMRLFEKTKSLDSSDLKIRADLLYALFVDDKFAEPVKRQVLREAKKKWVNMARAEQLQREHDRSGPQPPDWLLLFDELRRCAGQSADKGAELEQRNDVELSAKQIDEVIDWLSNAAQSLRTIAARHLAEAAE